MKITQRKQSLPVKIGNIVIGNQNPVALQSMTNTDTNNIEATVAQVKRIVDAGASLVRITVPSMRECEAMKCIKNRLRSEGIKIPLIADVHFNPKVAERMATVVAKVRINPGNYVDKRNFKQLDFTDSEYAQSLERMAVRAKPLLDICKEYGTALRIGSNHGSLCDRIVSRYGNSPLAMAMSATEWIDICENNNFGNIVISMKSSNVNTMMESTLLLTEMMRKKGTVYPLHIGVTEAGAGIEGRVKSAAGIGALLLNGVGDTIRVSLTENPENEIPFARKIVETVDMLQNDCYSIDEKGLMIYKYPEKDKELMMIQVAAACGYENYLGKVKELRIQNSNFCDKDNEELALLVLQACRIKMSNTEFIACPSCGRTQYDIEGVLELVKERFKGHPGLKIGVMGCIVNGPGEMADADFGIVGAADGTVAVYKGKSRISDIIPIDSALDILEKEILNYPN